MTEQPDALSLHPAHLRRLAENALLAGGAPPPPAEAAAGVEGPLPAILRGERVALNYLSHLSGVATATARLVEAIAGTDCRLRGTRKTTPGLPPPGKDA